MQRFGHDKGRSTHAQTGQEFLLRTELPGTHLGMDAVGADEQVRVERAVRRISDGDLTPSSSLHARKTCAP
ncbi:hypothetical protein [Arthrobacter sp. AFG20]|uniref:hypothetical protein n=1 Tax=Arthrobacter sp. AFG20 TaxID=1688671 RepID=UPI000C9E9B3D|nr:hypothetical protein [Arthrobacter sp. AFG20]